MDSNRARLPWLPAVLTILPFVAFVLLLSTGAYEYDMYKGNGGTDDTVYSLLLATIIIAAIGFFPSLVHVLFYDLQSLLASCISMGILLIPASVHFAFHIRGRTDTYYGCDIADMVCACFALVFLGYIQRGWFLV